MNPLLSVFLDIAPLPGQTPPEPEGCGAAVAAAAAVLLAGAACAGILALRRRSASPVPQEENPGTEEEK